MEKRYFALAENLWGDKCGLKEFHHLVDLAAGLYRVVEFVRLGVAEPSSCEAEAGLLIAQEGNRYEEDWLALLGVAVDELLRADGHVGVFLGVLEGKNCASGCEKLGKCEGRNVRANDWLFHMCDCLIL